MGVLVRNLRTMKVVYWVNVSEFWYQLTWVVPDKWPLTVVVMCHRNHQMSFDTSK